VGEDGSASVLVIGVGNPDRGDDGAGPRVVALLLARGVNAVDHAGDGLALIDLWKDRSRVVIVDAMVTGGVPGSILRFDTDRAPLPRRVFHMSSHVFGLAEGLEMARILGRLPAALIVYGIEGESFCLGAGLSGPVEGACRRVEREIVAKFRD
jgi:hydrogenase maturation protease